VTARGALAGMFVLCLVACLLGAWQGHDVLAGLGFCLTGVLAPVYGRREAQLAVVLSAPVIFLLAELVTQVLTAQGSSGHSSVLSVLEGTVLTLADVAPWLFAGTLACVTIAMARGLPDCVRRLRAEQGGLSGFRGSGLARPAGPHYDPSARNDPSARSEPSARGPLRP
jgi:hypothetical protein